MPVQFARAFLLCKLFAIYYRKVYCETVCDFSIFVQAEAGDNRGVIPPEKYLLYK